MVNGNNNSLGEHPRELHFSAELTRSQHNCTAMPVITQDAKTEHGAEMRRACPFMSNTLRRGALLSCVGGGRKRRLRPGRAIMQDCCCNGVWSMVLSQDGYRAIIPVFLCRILQLAKEKSAQSLKYDLHEKQ